MTLPELSPSAAVSLLEHAGFTHDDARHLVFDEMEPGESLWRQCAYCRTPFVFAHHGTFFCSARCRQARYTS